MLSRIAAGDLALLAAVIVAGGVCTGLLSGLFGVGGGAIIVPVLYEVFRALHVPEEIRMQLCVGPRSPSSCRPRSAPIGRIVRKAMC